MWHAVLPPAHPRCRLGRHGTGIAVLASIAAQLNHTGRPIRVVVADEQLRRQLPRTAGLHNIFASIDDAIRFGAGTPETRP